MTTNHNYNTPEPGTENWNVPLNDNFDRLDADVEIRDVEANREEYEPKQNAKFLSTDTGTVFIGDGDSWNRLGAIPLQSANIYIQTEEPQDPVEPALWIRPTQG